MIKNTFLSYNSFENAIKQSGISHILFSWLLLTQWATQSVTGVAQSTWTTPGYKQAGSLVICQMDDRTGRYLLLSRQPAEDI